MLHRDMLRTIGQRDGGESLIELLSACHDRIRRFAAMAVALAANPGAPDAAETAAAIRRYFTEALPLHERDEEESLAPRLRGHDGAVDLALGAMLHEHGENRALVAAVLDACAAPATLASPAAALAAHLEAHLAGEEAVIFPAVAALPADVQAAIAGELRARRTPKS